MILAALILQTTAAVPATPPPATAPQPTVQQQFDAATADAAAGRCPSAITGFEALEQRVSEQRSPFVMATIRARKGICLEQGTRWREAQAALDWALPRLDPANPVSAEDVYGARFALGRIRFRGGNSIGARESLAAALAIAPDDRRAETLLWLARANTFERQDDGIAFADQALALVSGDDRATRRIRASARTVKARIMLNQGRHAEAFAELRRALDDQGGLDLSVTAADIVTRSDLALAATLTGNREDARRYLCYTGAGRIDQGPFEIPGQLAPPACGAETGLQPDDVAVVEFGILDSGAVAYASTIYVSRSSEAVAAAFADSVRQWSWRSEDVVRIQPLFRSLTRVELRCSNAGQQLNPVAFIKSDFDLWLASAGLEPFDGGDSAARGLILANAELARVRGAGGGVALVPLLYAIATNPLSEDAQRSPRLDEAVSLARAASATPGAIATLELALARFRGPDDDDFNRELRTMRARPEYAADAQISAVLRLLAARPLPRRGSSADAASLLQAVATDERLPTGHPLKVSALVRLANLQAEQGDIAAARLSYAATGLDAQQCALVDAQPVMRRSGASTADFPEEAFQWGFEGLVRVEYDITADGRTTAQRATIAYPPLVFRDAALGIIRDARFSQSYRPDGTAGCGGASQSIRFQLPD
jgi:tetratricopeptide (TPR) repeat protein